MTEAATPLKRTPVGRVVSNEMDEAITVLIENRVKHPLYDKYVVRSKEYRMHDEVNRYSEGDKVEITGSRPFSRTKSRAMSCLLEAVRVIQNNSGTVCCCRVEIMRYNLNLSLSEGG